MKTLARKQAVCAFVPFEQTPHLSQEFESILNEAASVLSYRPAVEEEVKNLRIREQEIQRSNEIRQALSKLDDPPFDPKAVTHYKRKMHQSSKLRDEWISDNICWPIFACALVGFVTGVILWIGLRLFSSTALWWVEMCNWINLTIGLVSFITGGCLGCRIKGDKVVGINTKTKWEEISITNYRKPIPEFVLQTAIELKKKFDNDVNFTIEELRVTREEKVILDLSDPFLRVDLPDGSKYYLEVWNEPTFVGKRIA